jgi:hypothetical protein
MSEKKYKIYRTIGGNRFQLTPRFLESLAYNECADKIRVEYRISRPEIRRVFESLELYPDATTALVTKARCGCGYSSTNYNWEITRYYNGSIQVGCNLFGKYHVKMIREWAFKPTRKKK